MSLRTVLYRKINSAVHKLQFMQNSTTCFCIKLTQAQQVQSTTSTGSQKQQNFILLFIF